MTNHPPHQGRWKALWGSSDHIKVVAEDRNVHDRCMSARVSWLHLSDLHRGQSGDRRWLNHKHVIFDDIRRLCEELGQPDLILFTGDLAQRALPTEYALVNETIQEVRDAIGAAVPVFPVPGNHDLDRSAIPPHGLPAGLTRYLERDDSAAWEARKELMDRTSGPILGAISTQFSNYQSWFTADVVPEWQALGWEPTFGALPGDVQLLVEFDGLVLGLAGVNSAFLDYRDSVRTVAVESSQLGSDSSWTRNCHASLLLMHHPPSWVHSDWEFNTHIYPSERFLAVLYGHIHLPVIQGICDPRVRRYVPAPSLAGIEDYLVPGGEDRILGYGYGQLVQDESHPTQGELSFWIRRLEIAPGGEPTMRSDPGCEPRTFPVKLRSLPVASTPISSPHYPPRLDDALGALAGEAEQLYRDGQLAAARAEFQSVAQKAAPEGGATTPQLQRRAAHARLMAAVCLFEQGERESAMNEFTLIDVANLEAQGLAALASAYAQLGHSDLARELVGERSGEEFLAVKQLADLADGTLPDSPISAYVCVRGAFFLLSESKFAEGVQWALRAADSTDEPAITANVVDALLAAAEASLYGPATRPFDANLAERAVGFLEAAIFEVTPRVTRLVGEIQLARWHARLAILNQDFEEVERAREQLRGLGVDNRSWGGPARVVEESDNREDREQPDWQVKLDAALTLPDEEQLTVLEQAAQKDLRIPLIVAASRAALRLGRPAIGLAHARRAFEMWPGSGQRLLLAHSLYAASEFQRVEELLRGDKFLAGRPAALRLRAVNTSATFGEEATAVDRWRAYVAAAPHDLAGRVGLAWALFLVGSMAEARAEVPGIVAELREVGEASPELLARLSSLIVATTRDLDANSSELRRVALMARDLADDIPAAGGLYLMLWHRLTDVGDLPPPDYARLVEQGVLTAVDADEAVGHLKQLHRLSSAIGEGYVRGFIPFEAVIEETRTTAAEVVERTIHFGARFTAPSPTGFELPVFANKRLLLGHLELLLLVHFRALAPLVDALGEHGTLVTFQDVLEKIQREPLELHQRAQLGELGRLRTLVSMLEAAEALPASEQSSDSDWCDAHGVVRVSAQLPPDVDAVELREFVRQLVRENVLPLRALRELGIQADAEPSDEAPCSVALDYASLLELDDANLLSFLLESSQLTVVVGPETQRLLRSRVEELALISAAARRAGALLEKVGALQRTGRLRTTPRPAVQLPPPAPGFDHRYGIWIEMALSWIEALVADEAMLLLSADLLAAGMLAGATPLDLMRTLRWQEAPARYEPMLRRRHALRDRVATLGDTVRHVVGAESRSEVLAQLVALGFADAYSAADVVALAEDWRGLNSEQPVKLLDSLEAPARAASLHQAAHFPLSVGQLYCQAIWSCWELEAQSRERTTHHLLTRLEHLPHSLGRPALELSLRLLLAVSSLRPDASVKPQTETTVVFSEESSVGRMWSSIARWVNENQSDRLEAFRAAFRTAIVEDTRVGTDEQTIVRSGPLYLAAVLVDGNTTESIFPFASAFEAMAIMSGVWIERPLEMLAIDFKVGEDEPRESFSTSCEQLIALAAKNLNRDEVTATDTGLNWLVPIAVGKSTIGVLLPPEAILLRAEPDHRARLAADMAAIYRHDDGRGSRLLRTISSQPTSQDALTAYAEHAVSAPWRRVRANAGDLLSWGSGDQLYPASIEELREMLSEPRLGDEHILDEVLGRASDVWANETGLFLQSVRLPGRLSMLLFDSRLQQEPRELFSGLAASLERMQRPDDLPIGELLEDVFLTTFIAQLSPDRTPLVEAMATLLRTLADGPASSTFAGVEHRVLVACANAVARLSIGPRPPTVRETVWLSWRLFQWLLAQVKKSGRDLVSAFSAVANAGVPRRPGLPEVLDPVRFGPTAFDHRLASVLHALCVLTPAALRNVVGADAATLLETLRSRPATTAENELQRLPREASTLGWGDTPRSISGIAAELLETLARGESSPNDEEE